MPRGGKADRAELSLSERIDLRRQLRRKELAPQRSNSSENPTGSTNGFIFQTTRRSTVWAVCVQGLEEEKARG